MWFNKIKQNASKIIATPTMSDYKIINACCPSLSPFFETDLYINFFSQLFYNPMVLRAYFFFAERNFFSPYSIRGIIFIIIIINSSTN